MTRKFPASRPPTLAVERADPWSSIQAAVMEAPEEVELLAALLAGESEDVRRQEAGSLLMAFGDLARLVASDEAALAHAGLGPRARVRVIQARKLAVAMLGIEARRRPVLSSWSALVAYLRADLAHAPREQFRVLYLDKRNILMREEHRAEGTVDQAPVYVREVVRRALELSASALILAHNHPSGDPAPSRADIEMTRRIIDGARLFDILVHDHVVVGREGVQSFRALGLIGDRL